MNKKEAVKNGIMNDFTISKGESIERTMFMSILKFAQYP